MTDHVRTQHQGDALHITLARPDRRNAITVAMYSVLADAIEAAAESGVRVITIKGEGEDFTAGNDLADFLNALPRDGEDIPVWRLLRALVRNPVPLVALVHGNAVGIGTTMLFHCDLVIAEDSTRFRMPFVDLGLVPEAASSLILPKLAGRRRAARYFLLGETFGAEEAREFGLVSHCVACGKGEEKLEEIVDALLAKPAQALRLTQDLLRRGDKEALLERIELENGHFSERLESNEVRNAIEAFFAKRASVRQAT